VVITGQPILILEQKISAEKFTAVYHAVHHHLSHRQDASYKKLVPPTHTHMR